MARVIRKDAPVVPRPDVTCTTLSEEAASDAGADASWEEDVRTGADPRTRAGDLAQLGKGHVWARWAVASNPACPVALLRELAVDDAPLVRHAVASNPSVPIDVRRRLATDPDLRVRVRAKPE